MILSFLTLAIFFAQPPYIYDGDTFYYHHLGLRLHGINAPEMDAAFGVESRDALRNYLEGKNITCQDDGEDKYRRRLVRCAANGQDISKWMVANGWAVAYVYFSKDYIADEAYARERHLGMFRKQGMPQNKPSQLPSN